MKGLWKMVMAGSLIIGMTTMAGAEDKPGDAKNGQSIYVQHCQRCHGAKGKGDGPDAASLSIKPPSFLSPESRTHTDDEFLAILVWGTVYSPMHGYWDRLTREEMQDVVAYIRTLAPYHSMPGFRMLE